MTSPADFAHVSTYVTFVGNGRTGTSLVAAMIDAHENAVLSHQLQAMRRIRRCTRDALFERIVAVSQKHARKGKRHYQYRYAIPGSWQGRYTTLKVIGDKYAGPDTDRLAKNDFALLDHLEEKMAGIRLKFVHMIRNPYDSIATHKKRYYTTLRRAMATSFRREAIVQGIRDRGYDVLDIWQERLLVDPEPIIGGLFAWLELPVDDDFVRRCASIVFHKPHLTRNNVRWPGDAIEQVATVSGQYPWLRDYRF